MDLSMIVAMTHHGAVIGNNGELPWERGCLPGDMDHFRNITLKTGVMIMGYDTYVSIIHRNKGHLLGRRHIVLTRKNISLSHPAVEFVGSVEEAFAEVAKNGNHAVVIGGEQIFRLFLSLPEVTTAYITEVHADLHGDVLFPGLVPTEGMSWKCVDFSDVRKANFRDKYETCFKTYERRPLP